MVTKSSGDRGLVRTGSPRPGAPSTHIVWAARGGYDAVVDQGSGGPVTVIGVRPSVGLSEEQWEKIVAMYRKDAP